MPDKVLLQHAIAIKNMDGMPMNLNRDNTSRGSTFKSQSHRLLFKLPNVEGSEEQLKLKQVGATECNGLKAVSRAPRVDSKAQT